ncbi:hypothetical protein D9M68_871930 [compost metagenome]
MEALRRQPPHAVEPIGLTEHARKVKRVQRVRPVLVHADEEMAQVSGEGVEQRQRQIASLVDEEHEVIGEDQTFEPVHQSL